jgi:hypothetical protein
MSGKINSRFNTEKKILKWYISHSLIEGHGAFAVKEITCGEVIDTAVIEMVKISFFCSKINHSWNPCAKLIKNLNNYDVVAIQNISKDQEITINYNYTPFFIQKPNPNWI